MRKKLISSLLLFSTTFSLCSCFDNVSVDTFVGEYTLIKNIVEHHRYSMWDNPMDTLVSTNNNGHTGDKIVIKNDKTFSLTKYGSKESINGTVKCYKDNLISFVGIDYISNTYKFEYFELGGTSKEKGLRYSSKSKEHGVDYEYDWTIIDFAFTYDTNDISTYVGKYKIESASYDLYVKSDSIPSYKKDCTIELSIKDNFIDITSDNQFIISDGYDEVSRGNIVINDNKFIVKNCFDIPEEISFRFVSNASVNEIRGTGEIETLENIETNYYSKKSYFIYLTRYFAL